MAELTVTDGRPPPAGLPDGECIGTRLDGGAVRVDRADPCILISGELLDEIVRFADSGHLAGNWLALNAWLDTTACQPGYGYVGAVLKIDGVNRHVVYHVTGYVPRINGYIGEWPD
jgi:hypothetical protein